MRHIASQYLNLNDWVSQLHFSVFCFNNIYLPFLSRLHLSYTWFDLENIWMKMPKEENEEK